MVFHVFQQDSAEALTLAIRVRPDDEQVPILRHLLARERLLLCALHCRAVFNQNALRCLSITACEIVSMAMMRLTLMPNGFNCKVIGIRPPRMIAPALSTLLPGGIMTAQQPHDETSMTIPLLSVLAFRTPLMNRGRKSLRCSPERAPMK